MDDCVLTRMLTASEFNQVELEHAKFGTSFVLETMSIRNKSSWEALCVALARVCFAMLHDKPVEKWKSSCI